MRRDRDDAAGGDDRDATVFVPVTRAQWRQLVADRRITGPVVGYGVTAALQEWGGFGPEDAEDALFAAQAVAGVAALTLAEDDPDARRMVLAVPAAGFTPDDGSALGAGEVATLELARIRAVFSDDPSVAVAPVRQQARGLDPAAAWDHPVVAEFSDAHDLGWYTVAEALGW